MHIGVRSPLQAVTSATRMADRIEILKFRVSEYDNRNTVDYRSPRVLTALDQLFSKCRPRAFQLDHFNDNPCLLVRKLDTSNLSTLHLQISVYTSTGGNRRNTCHTVLSDYERLLVKILPQLEHLQVRDLAIFVLSRAVDRAGQSINCRLRSLEVLALRPLPLPPQWSNLAEATNANNMASAFGTLLKACSTTLQCLNISGLQANLASMLPDYFPELRQMKSLERFNFRLQRNLSAWALQLESLQVLRRLQHVVVRMPYRSEGAVLQTPLKQFLEILLTLYAEDRLMKIKSLDCTLVALTERAESSPPLGDNPHPSFLERFEWPELSVETMELIQRLEILGVSVLYDFRDVCE